MGNRILTGPLATRGLLRCVASNASWISFCCLTVALVGITAARALACTIPARFLTGIAAAGRFVFINSVGTLDGFVGPAVAAWLQDLTGSFSAGLAGMGGFLLLSSVLALVLRRLAPRDYMITKS